MLKLKLQYFGHLMRRANSLEKTLMLGKIEGKRRGWQRMRWLEGITNLKTSVLWHSAFFMVQLSHLYMTTGKTIALTMQTFVGKVMALLFNMLINMLFNMHSFSSKEQDFFFF